MSDLEEVMRTETESDEYEDLYQGWVSTTIQISLLKHNILHSYKILFPSQQMQIPRDGE